MSRIGYDQKIHPYYLQLRLVSIMDPQGVQNKSSITLNLQDGKIIRNHTDENQMTTMIKEYIVGDDDLKELYSFFTLNAIKEFEAMPESVMKQYEIGYYDEVSLRYFLICGDGRISDGKRHRIYSSDPINMVIEWIHKTAPSDLFL